jgi:hypothetical protein
MTFEYDERGKIYTNIISKVSVSAIVQTTMQLIRGTLHICQGERVKDELDRDELFLAITEASVLASDGTTVLHQAPFLAVRRAQIVWIIPAEEEETR